MLCTSSHRFRIPFGLVATPGQFTKGLAVARRLTLRDLPVAAFLLLAASSIVHAEEHLQDWIPDVLSMPEDAEVMMDRTIGSTVRMLSITTETDVAALFDEWEESLETNGYPISRHEGEVLQNLIEFSGPGIANAKIILAPTAEEGRNVIEFDATLD